ncbi:DUF4397 domain-containing protein [Kaistella sp.]|uniref:DUF4397 domain-containing protein n=1 Tax=Kaistella sp. TaxID=2782235 RepID=UPI003C3FC279
MRKLLGIFFLGLIFANITVGCSRDYEADEQFPQGGDFKIINSANLGLPLAIYFNENRIIEQSLYNTQTSYFRVKNTSGTINVSTSTNEGVENNVLSINDTYELNKNVTYFLVNSITNPSSLTFIKANDDVAAPDYDKAKIRIANLSSNLGSNIDVIVGGQVVISNVAPNSVSEFVTVKSRTAVNVVKTGTTTTLKSLGTTNFLSTGIYTLVLNGNAATGATPALALASFSNAK